MKVEVKLSEQQRLTEYIENFMSENNVPVPVIMKINIAIDEIFSNIVKFSGATFADVSCEITDAAVRLCFEDDGIPYNPLENEDADISLSAEERSIGGLGIYMVKKTMDDMKYRYTDGKNILTIEKKYS